MLWKILTFSVPPGEIVLRGSLIYLGVIVMLRLSGRRQTGGVGTSDLLMVVFLADAVQNGMAGAQKSIMDALLLAATIISWNHTLDWLAHRSRLVSRLLTLPALLIVRDGRMLRGNMRQELITVDELMGLLREQGVQDLSCVKACYLEGDGHVSVIPIREAGGAGEEGTQ
jgi:uncharacterized membrane protein YcaP (DUF421 family)